MILSIDQGTTGTTVLILSPDGEILGRAYSEFRQIFPQPGWVSHNAEEIWETTLKVIGLAINNAGIQATDIKGIGITNQRETTVLWDRTTGKPVHDAIVWQCRRTSDLCDQYRAQGLEETVRAKTGLVIDAYFSATKIVWLLEHVEGLRTRAQKGEICFGTIDTFLLFKLTGGAAFATEYTNASRTMIYNIHTREWDDELLQTFDIPNALLPKVRPSSGEFGTTINLDVLPAGIPIGGIAGDQQAALFGQRGVQIGDIKNPYGTGCFPLSQTGSQAIPSNHGLLTTLACDATGQVSYALEGSVFSAGSAVQWLRDGLGIIQTAAETESLAESITDTGGVYLVPAFTGLGAPHWNANARGTIVGITRGTERAHLARAALESIAYQSADLVTAMSADAQQIVSSLRVDGGAVVNNFLMQFQADILNVQVIRPKYVETTALGAGMLAGLATGVWKNADALVNINPPEHTFEPNMSQDQRETLLAGWQKAIDKTQQ
ncbi:MAG: glycerol kinase GlpK [Candidatus Latescibacteria bacterium]|nr:glycerol kinase GlpK [Candidatus Latescibacterota bacterium]